MKKIQFKFHFFIQQLIIIIFNNLNINHCWKYQTECTKTPILNQHDFNDSNMLELKCPKVTDYLFIGTTQYGVRQQTLSATTTTTTTTTSFTSQASSIMCTLNDLDCLVSVDYLSNECNGLNSCLIQLDSQYLHSCKNYSDYISIAYKCISKENEINVCSNEELQMNDSSQDLFLTSSNYPNEYANNLKCSCQITNVNNQHQALTQLALTLYEFDTEDDCIKDRLDISELNGKKQTLCGQLKEFKEIFTHASTRIQLNFTTDDALTRRGFLIKINSLDTNTIERSTTNCEHGDYFSQEKCIKLINEKYTFNQARAYCAQTNGNLLLIQDFVDNMKLNSYLRDINFDVSMPIWSLHTSKRRVSSKIVQCLVKRANQWSYEPCDEHKQFICEYRNKNVNSRSRTSQKSKLKISCGSSMLPPSTTIKTTKTTTSTTTTTSTLTTSTSTTNSKIIKSFLSVIDENKQSSNSGMTHISTSTQITNVNLKLVNNKQAHEGEVEKSSNDLALLIGTISGVSIILVFLNIFCVWNFYNHKVKTYLKHDDKKSSSSSSSNSSTTSSASSNTTSELIYASEKDLGIMQGSDGLPHVYESIPSVHYCQSLPQHFDSFASSSEACLISRQGTLWPIRVSNLNGHFKQHQQVPIIMLQNGQNYCMTNNNNKVNDISPVSALSTTSSQRPLTTTFGNPMEAIV